MGNRCFTILFDGAYFLLAVMVEGYEVAGSFGWLLTLIDSPDILSHDYDYFLAFVMLIMLKSFFVVVYRRQME